MNVVVQEYQSTTKLERSFHHATNQSPAQTDRGRAPSGFNMNYDLQNILQQENK